MIVKARIDMNSVRITSRRLDALKKYAHDKPWNMINIMAGYFVTSATSLTPVSKRKRALFTARNAAETRALGYRYAVKVYGRAANKTLSRRLENRSSAAGAVVTDRAAWWRTNDKQKAESWRDITFRGAAKASWAGMRGKMKMTYTLVSDVLKTIAYRYNWVKFIRNPGKQSIILVNKLPYVSVIAPNVAGRAMAKAQARLQHTQKRAFEIGMQATWQRAA